MMDVVVKTGARNFIVMAGPTVMTDMTIIKIVMGMFGMVGMWLL
jgi:hypothetical protein